MAFPTYAVPTGASAPGSAATTFLSAAAGAGLQLQTLPQIAQIHIAVANLLGQTGATQTPGDLVVNGTLTTTGVATIGGTAGQFNFRVAGDLVGDRLLVATAVAASGVQIESRNAAENALAPLFFAGSTYTLSGMGSGTGVISVGAADSGGAGFKLLRVPN